jgi:hypothetical protein
MNTTTKIAIAGGAAVSAFLIYKVVKKQIDEAKKKEEAAQLKAAEEAQKAAAAEAAAAKAKQSEARAKTATGAPTAYEKRIAVLQELLKVSVDMKAGTQTNGELDYWWSQPVPAPQTEMNVQQRKALGYPNLNKNGKGVVSPLNIEYYISTLQSNNSPRQVAYKTKSGGTSATSEAASRRKQGENLLAAKKAGKSVVPRYSVPPIVAVVTKDSRGWYVPVKDKTVTIALDSDILSWNTFENFDTDGFMYLYDKYKRYIKVNPYVFIAV